MPIDEKERNNNAIDLLVTMTLEELANEQNRKPTEIFKDFLASKTAAELYDEETKTWWDGPSAVAQMYREEVGEINQTE